jgi:DNA polymerase-3 subunit gamma/tau
VAYTVVARRYRPQRFEDVVGQDHVVQALRNAIRLNRVTHAYLFSGTRGVGKTSIARIFAKCLNCVRGPTEEPDLTCEICRDIAVGQDVDVIEIDGASNNGVEAVRELRQNAGLRPSRARFKIYYIDEVHMLSTGAFNALLKTLEEPPSHVKFFFATTEPNKIPITVLSRCQRYDFAGISPEAVVASLAEICEAEQVKADPEALAVLGRRAGGSMRDAQSLLEQLLSFGGDRLTVELVQQQLGIASDDRTLDLLDAISQRDLASALRVVDQTSSSGVQPTELLAGALDFLRDAMILAARADVPLLATTPRQRPRLQGVADRWSLDTLLAALQILAEARGRLRGSPHGRILVEIALAKVARLEDLGELGTLVSRLAAMEGGAVALPAVEKKKREVTQVVEATSPTRQVAPDPASAVVAEAPVEPSNSGAAEVAKSPDASSPVGPGAPAWSAAAIAEVWPAWVQGLERELGSKLAQLRPVETDGASILVLGPGASYNSPWVFDACERPEIRGPLEAALRGWLGRTVELRFARPSREPVQPARRNPGAAARDEGLGDDPLVKQLVEQFEARAIRVELDDGPAAPDG